LFERVFQVRDHARIDGLDPSRQKLPEALPADWFARDSFDFQVGKDLASECQDLVLEVFAQFAKGQVVEVLQLGLVRQGLDKWLAVPFFELAADQGADAVLLSSLFRIAVCILQGQFKVFLRSDWLP